MAEHDYTFNVAMTCGGCAGQVERVLGKLGDKVKITELNVEQKTVKVRTSLSQEEILEQLKKTGKEVTAVP